MTNEVAKVGIISCWVVRSSLTELEESNEKHKKSFFLKFYRDVLILEISLC